MGSATLRRLARLAMTIGVLLAAPMARGGAQAQNQLFQRAIDLENAGRNREAIAAWRIVIANGLAAQGISGLQRVFSQLGQEDSVLAPLDTALQRAPTDRVLRGVQLRVLQTLGRDDEARAAFHAWASLAPRDPTPYREFAAQLLGDGRNAAADTVLREATAVLGSAKGLATEVAQLRAALGLWTQAAFAWRDAMIAEQYLEQSAIYSLTPAPAEKRDSMRVALLTAPVSPSARKALGSLEVAWGSAREGWHVLSVLTVADSAYDAWSEFADEAEHSAAWLAARDAVIAMQKQRPATPLALRAATDALNGGEPATALPMLAAARDKLTPAAARTQVLPLEARALSQLGRGAELEALLGKSELDDNARRGYARALAWAWIRGGQIDKARAALSGATADDEDEVTGWLALYDGDFAIARAGLRRPVEATSEVVTAMAVLGRTRADRSPATGAAFLALARGDSTGAAVQFTRAADEISDAAPLLLALAARIQSARKQDAAAITIWKRIVNQYAAAPEAAESDLEWGRTLRRHGDPTGATERFEHLILSYPRSALVPQARRELELLRTGASTE
jgi:tetratricopeptide (TPR) repeat protein